MRVVEHGSVLCGAMNCAVPGLNGCGCRMPRSESLSCLWDPMPQRDTSRVTRGQSEVGLRKLLPNEREAAAHVLARAFWDDPLMAYIWPTDVMRWTMLPSFMRSMIELAAAKRESFTVGVAPVGAALWLPPGHTKLPTTRVLRVMVPRMWPWPASSLVRFLRVMGDFQRRHIRYPHWYLMRLGIDPPKQGRGYGTLLMSDALRRADEQRVDAYLEAQNAQSVAFYEKQGFAVVDHFVTDKGRGPQSWTMLRKPRI